MRREVALALLVPPVVAAAVSSWLPARGEGLPIGIRGPDGVTWTRAPCGEPSVDAALAELGELLDGEADVRAREDEWGEVLAKSLAECKLELEVLAVDCADQPCLVVGRHGSADLWSELTYCRPLYDRLHGRPLGAYTRTVQCADGPTEVEGTWLAAAPDPPAGSREWRIEEAVRHERFDALVHELACAP
jgi:hypothetical protein